VTLKERFGTILPCHEASLSQPPKGEESNAKESPLNKVIESNGANKRQFGGEHQKKAFPSELIPFESDNIVNIELYLLKVEEKKGETSGSKKKKRLREAFKEKGRM